MNNSNILRIIKKTKTTEIDHKTFSDQFFDDFFTTLEYAQNRDKLIKSEKIDITQILSDKEMELTTFESADPDYLMIRLDYCFLMDNPIRIIVTGKYAKEHYNEEEIVLFLKDSFLDNANEDEDKDIRKFIMTMLAIARIHSNEDGCKYWTYADSIKDRNTSNVKEDITFTGLYIVIKKCPEDFGLKVGTKVGLPNEQAAFLMHVFNTKGVEFEGPFKYE